MPGDFKYRMSASIVMLHPINNTPLLETGREAVTTISTKVIEGKTEAEAMEIFLALQHEQTVALWDREVKRLWFPEEKKPTTPS